MNDIFINNEEFKKVVDDSYLRMKVFLEIVNNRDPIAVAFSPYLAFLVSTYMTQSLQLISSQDETAGVELIEIMRHALNKTLTLLDSKIYSH